MLGQFEVWFAAVLGGGPSTRLPCIVGRGRTFEILLGGEDFDGELAERYGYVNRAVPDAEFVEFVDRFAERVSRFGLLALADIKRFVNTASLPADQALADEMDAFGRPPLARLFRSRMSPLRWHSPALVFGQAKPRWHRRSEDPVGNAVTQLARAQGAKHAMSSTTNHAKAKQAKVLGFNEVIDTSVEKLGDGVRRITGGYGADIVIDGIGGEVLAEALGALAPGGSLTTLGYSGGRKATIDVRNLIWQQAGIQSFILFSQPHAALADAWNTIISLLQSGAIKPIVAKTFPLAEAANALRYLVEGRPFGRVVLTI